MLHFLQVKLHFWSPSFTPISILVPLQFNSHIQSPSFINCFCKIGLLNGLATGARDMVGLNKSRTSFLLQVFYSLGTQRKITFCLSPTSGVVQLGKVVHESQPGPEIFRSLTLTGFIITPFFFFFLLPCVVLCVYDCLSGLFFFFLKFARTIFKGIYKTEGPNV